MSEMIERVRNAIDAALGEVGGWQESSEEDMNAVARAAIEAMREPTKEMEAVYLVAGSIAQEDVWPAMIDAALSEKP